MTTTDSLNRRSLLARAGICGGLAAAALRIDRVEAAHPRNPKLTVDMAILGPTLRFALAPGPNDPDGLFVFRGGAMYYEADLFREGTIRTGAGWDPSNTEPVGRLFSWGALTEDLRRNGNPLLVTTHHYVLGAITAEQHFPPDQIVSNGMEFVHTDTGTRFGTVRPEPAQRNTRPLTGGAGEYLGAAGVVVQQFLGSNTTQFDPAGAFTRYHGAMPNYRLSFHLLPAVQP